MNEINSRQKFEILIVDDMKDNLLALNSLLERDDVSVSQAKSGEDALELMLKHDFCLALLDVQMPSMNGFELAELMRGKSKTKNIPIIFVTAVAKNQKFEFRGYETGAVDYIIKPIDPYILKCKVSVFLELHKQKVELKELIEVLRKPKEEQIELLKTLDKIYKD